MIWCPCHALCWSRECCLVKLDLVCGGCRFCDVGSTRKGGEMLPHLSLLKLEGHFCCFSLKIYTQLIKCLGNGAFGHICLQCIRHSYLSCYRCFHLAIGTVQIAHANFVGLLVGVVLKEMPALSSNAVCVRKNVIKLSFLCFEVHSVGYILFSCFIIALTIFWLKFFVDHKSCMLEMDAIHVDSASLASSFCEQKCKEVSLFRLPVFNYLKICKQFYKYPLCLITCAQHLEVTWYIMSWRQNITIQYFSSL